MEERRSGRRTELVVLGTLILAALVTSLWSLHLEAPPASAAAGLSAYPSGYQQTWTVRYTDTTCDDWVRRMSEPQRWAAAADLLRAARRVDGVGSGAGSGVGTARTRPPDDLVSAFEDEFSRTCLTPTATITDVAATVYRTSHARYSA